MQSEKNKTTLKNSPYNPTDTPPNLESNAKSNRESNIYYLPVETPSK